MPALVHISLTDAPEIFLTVVSTFGVGFLLWFLVGLLRDERQARARQVHILRFTSVNFERRRREGAQVVPIIARTKIAGEPGKGHASSAPAERSQKNTVKMRWLILCLLLTATVRGFQTPPRPCPLLPAAESLVNAVALKT